MIWGHAIGVYLLAGVVLNGLGHLVRARWIASGQMKPLNLAPGRKWILPVAIVAATLLWPVFLITISVGWRIRRKTRKMEETLGYCAHASPFAPICNACRREMEAEKKAKAGAPSYIVGRRPGSPSGGEEQAGVAFLDTGGQRPVDKKAVEAAVKAYLARRSQNSGRGAQVSQGVGSVPTLPDSPPSSSLYRCSGCGLMLEGPAPASNAQGWPLCVPCKLGELKKPG